jgi:DNA-binding transcriptional LysR family regulator
MDFADLRERRVDVMLGRVALSALPDYVRADVLLHETLLVVTGGQNAWAHQRGIRFADLACRKWVLAPPGSAVHELVAAAFRAEGSVMPLVATTTWSMMLRLQLLSSDEYVTAFPDSLVRHNAARWNLQVLPVALGGPLPVAAFILKGRMRNRAIQAFIAAARAASGDGAGQAPGS